MAELFIPITIWNLNEIFTTESISPFSFYKVRNFGNPNSRLEGIEFENSLLLYSKKIKKEILLSIDKRLLDNNFLVDGPKTKPKTFQYYKTIYLKRGYFKLLFSSEELLNQFKAQSFMLLEVKTLEKFLAYEDNTFIISSNDSYLPPTPIQIMTSELNNYQPAFDKSINHIKGMLYCAMISQITDFESRDQNLLTSIIDLKNKIGGSRTNIAMSDLYDSKYIDEILLYIEKIQKKNEDIFMIKPISQIFNLTLRLKEIDKLFKLKCDALSNSNIIYQKNLLVRLQDNEERLLKQKAKIEKNLGIDTLEKELEKIKNKEKENGERKGKTRIYFKKGTQFYERKNEIKLELDQLYQDEKLIRTKQEIKQNDTEKRNISFSSSELDTSIDEQFIRISELLNAIIKNTINLFENKNNASVINVASNFQLDINIHKLTEHYMNSRTEYDAFVNSISGGFFSNLNEEESQLFKIAINAILSYPQGFIGNISEEHILKLLVMIGEKTSNNTYKDILRNFYSYKLGKKNELELPQDGFIQNLIVFFLKYQGYEQMNKFILNKKIQNKHLTFIIWGCFVGFGNLPKTYTMPFFNSKNLSLFDDVDNYIFSSFISKN
jgi:hypothetical protein